MPIVFIFCGCAFLLILFGCVDFASEHTSRLALCVLLLIMISYFVGDLAGYTFSINIIQFLLVFLLAIFAIPFRGKCSAVIIIITCIIYRLALSFNLDLLTSLHSDFAVMLLLFSSAFTISSLGGSIFNISLSAIIIGVISGVEAFNNFGILVIDMSFVLNAFCGYILLVLIYKCIYDYYFSRRRYCVKKIRNVSIYDNANFGIWF